LTVMEVPSTHTRTVLGFSDFQEALRLKGGAVTDTRKLKRLAAVRKAKVSL
jgi:hypothetical protein